MRPQLETLAEVFPERTVAEVMSLVMESRHQVQQATDTIAKAISRLEIDGHARTRQSIVDALDQLRRVKPLIDKIDERTFGNHAGFVAEQGRMVLEGLAVANAEFEKAALAFAANRAR